MLFRVVLIGNTRDYANNLAVAKELNRTASVTVLGVICPDDVVELKVNSVDEGKQFMKQFYKRTGHLPKRYEYVDGESFWTADHDKYIGTRVWNDSPAYHNKDKKEDFLTFFGD